MRTRGIVFSLVLLAALGTAFLKWPRTAKAKDQAAPFPTAPVKRESFDVTLRVAGVLEAAKSEPMIATVQDTPIAWIAVEGASVKPGDVVVRLSTTEKTKQLTEQEQQDAQAAQQERTSAEDSQRRVQTAKVGVEKAKSDLELTQSQGKASVDRATAQLHQTEKELEVATNEYDRKKRLADERLLPLTQLESAADQLKSQEFQLETSKRELAKAQREAEVNEQVKKLDIHKAELEVQGAESAQRQNTEETARSRNDRQVRLTEARTQVAEAEMKAHTPGLVLVEDTWDESGMRKLRAGDKVWEGMRVARVIDPSLMLVTCDIGEGDIGRVRIGQPGAVRVEALGNARLRGKVTAIDNISRERSIWEGNSAKRIFRVKLELSDRDARLRPGMSGTVEIAVERANDGLAVPAEAVFEDGGKQMVYRREGTVFARVPVKVLRRGEMVASVQGELRVGDAVALRLPPASRLVGAKEKAR